ncbi:hypothetical protein B0H13DRAFT_1880510 [Mycena leptocephala]|nr:hypothetical protein B0H13DRAFT_1880510 [Mycena leptocephala]
MNFDDGDHAPQENDSGEPDAIPPPPAPAHAPGSAPQTGSGRKRWRETVPGHGGATYGLGKTVFEEIRDSEILKGAEVLGPFKDEAEWELAKWLIKHVGHTAADEFLKLSIITDRARPSYKGKTEFFGKIDDLPGGVKWQCKEIDVKGDLPDLDKDPTGATMRGETVELWFRDPVECVRELIGNPMFRNAMRFGPEELYTDEKGQIRLFEEMWTGDWWKEIQKRLPPGATLAPLILSSDKTLLSNFRGDNSAWPVYLTIGNIGKETRRQVSAHATVLIGYLPIPKFDCFNKNTRSLAKYRLFHQCMSVILASVVEAGKTGVKMVCADNLCGMCGQFLPHMSPTIQSINPDERGDHLPHNKRDELETLFLMARQQDGEKDTAFEKEGIRAVYPPFWKDLPHSDIFQAFTPDLLHQLHKGVFKDHLVKWCTEIIGQVEVDERFRQMPDHPGLRHFKNGISSVSQWTGTEHKEMEKVFLGLVAAGAHPELVQAEHFNIPKIHSLEHYEPSIRLFGSADGFNTESPERLHIDYAKNAYGLPTARTTSFNDSVASAPRVGGPPPAATRRVVASHIIAKDGHNAIRFLPALSQFLRVNFNSSFSPYAFDVFPTWKRLKFTLPNIPEVGQRHATNLVRATAPVIPPGEARYRTVEPAYHDFALVKTAEANLFTEGTALQGLRIAQVRVIFQLPAHYPVKSSQPLAYIEWFTPLRSPNDVDGYYHVNRSTRKISNQEGPYAEIITVDRIVRNAMLIPHKWDQDSKFRVNSHIDGHSFCMFKLNYKDTLPV